MDAPHLNGSFNNRKTLKNVINKTTLGGNGVCMKRKILPKDV